MSTIRIALATVLLLCGGPALADQEAPNLPWIEAGDRGRCYVKSVPDEYWGEAGTSRLYRVGRDEDPLIATWPWFSSRLFLRCNAAGPDGVPGATGAIGVSVVRFGPWHRGHEASADDLAIAFYFDDRLLARYSTLDLAGSPDNVQPSVSHYQVIDRVQGFGTSEDGTTVFVVTTVDGRSLTFDIVTGRQR